MSSFWLALTFLTTLPAPRVSFDAAAFDAGEFGRAGRWYPLVGSDCGRNAGRRLHRSRRALPPVVDERAGGDGVGRAHRGLHLDGLADCCDGFFAPVDRTRRGEIMRDPRVGTFGALGLLLTLLLKIGALPATATPIPALLLTPMWARWLILPAARSPQAHPGGMGSSFAAGLTPTTLVVALIVPVTTTLALAGLTSRFATFALAVAVGQLVGLGAVQLARHKLGGVSGDVLGLVVEAGEVAMLLAFAVRF
ncbi:MAG: adenosylcobinamide-GDP ribazoletransferase [Caldilineaceae bacterium]|nr:adenosylcobinamide-GDP ribazoletransferase [Caldilineaceae bacterium]